MTRLLSRFSNSDALELRRDERDRAIEMLRLIEEEGWSHYEAQGGDDTIRDVTEKRANRQRQIIERMDRLITGLEARGA
ncbi:MAG: hypothetical protein ACXWUR_06160 [Allosphingosinicella sp.]